MYCITAVSPDYLFFDPPFTRVASQLSKSALMYAAGNGHAAVVDALIASGADVNAQDHVWEQNTLLIH